jgi:hypothetical protein
MSEHDEEPDAPPEGGPGAAEPAPWFGYIGILIAIGSMIVGLVLVVLGVMWVIGWLGR